MVLGIWHKGNSGSLCLPVIVWLDILMYNKRENKSTPWVVLHKMLFV